MENTNGFVIFGGRNDGDFEVRQDYLIASLDYKTGEYVSTIEISEAKVFKTLKQARIARTRLAKINETQTFSIRDNKNIETLWHFNGCFTHDEKHSRMYKASLSRVLEVNCDWKKTIGQLKNHRKTKTGMIKHMIKLSKEISEIGRWNTAPNGDPIIIDNEIEYTIIWPLKDTQDFIWPTVRSEKTA